MPNHLPQVAEAFGEKYGTEPGYNISGRAFTAPRESILIPARKGSLRHKHSYKHTGDHNYHTAPSRHPSSGRSSGILIHGLGGKHSQAGRNLAHKQSEKATQRKRRITLDDPQKLDIEVPSLGPGDPWAAGMGPEQQKEIREEQQKQYHNAERRRSSAASAFAENPKVAMRRASKGSEMAGIQDSLI